MRWYLKYQQSSIFVGLAGMAMGLTSCGESGYVTPSTTTNILGGTLNTRAAETTPHLSHNGRYLVFTSDRNSQTGIFLYDRQANSMVSLPGLNQPQSRQYQGNISADGNYIVYVSEQLGKTDIFLYSRIELKAENITKNFIGEVRNPSISGNGRFIVFEGNRSGQWDIEVYDRGLDIPLSLPSDPQ